MVALREIMKKFLLAVMVVGNNMKEVKEKVNGKIKTELPFTIESPSSGKYRRTIQVLMALLHAY